mgnify:CR=1 FL=1
MSEEMTYVTSNNLKEMQDYLKEHLDDYSLRDMADRFAMSQTNLQTHFIDEYGMSIYSYMKTLVKDDE